MADPIAPSDGAQKSVWLNPFGLALVAYYLVMAFVGLCIPDDILKANTWAKEFSDFMASIIPQIDRITALGIKPDVNRFYFSVLWLGGATLFSAVVIFMLARPFHSNEWKQVGKPKYQSFLFLSAILLMCGVWPQMLFWVHPSLGLTRSAFGNDLLRSFLAQIVFVNGPCLAMAATPFAFAAWYRQPNHYLEKKNG